MPKRHGYGLHTVRAGIHKHLVYDPTWAAPGTAYLGRRYRIADSYVWPQVHGEVGTVVQCRMGQTVMLRLDNVFKAAPYDDEHMEEHIALVHLLPIDEDANDL